MSAPALPGRPRLADHALPRRHFVDGVEVVVVHDTRSGDLVRMPPRAWALIEAADGTRDLGGLLLAASQRGELLRSSEVTSVLTDLHAAGLLADGIDPFALEPPPPACPPDAPLDVLPFFGLICDGSGACCAAYSTVRFTAEEAERARVLLPGAGGGGARTFLPLAGSGAQPSRSATMIDGACAFLAQDGACELHRSHGAPAKPAGCAIYPATHVYDGEAVRVSAGVECVCVAKSLGRPGGVPLVPEGAATSADLPPGSVVIALPEAIEIRPGETAPRQLVVRWSRAVLDALRPSGGIADLGAAAGGVADLGASTGGVTEIGAAADVAAIFWSLAAKVDAGDLSKEGARSAVHSAAPLDEASLRPWLAALVERTAAKQESAARWRSERDRVRQVSDVLATAAAALADGATLAAAIAGVGAEPQLEAFYLAASLHGHALLGDMPLAHALRDRAVRVLLARVIPAACAGSPLDLSHPLPLVEAMMRAQGVKEYARELPP